MPERAPSDKAGGGEESQLGSPEQKKDDSRTHGIPGLRQRSSHRSEQPDSSNAANQATRPGAGFELKGVLPDSAYGWACGGRGDGDERAPLYCSRVEVLSTWVILIVRAEVERWLLSLGSSVLMCGMKRSEVTGVSSLESYRRIPTTQ